MPEQSSDQVKVLVVSGVPPPYSGPEIMTAYLLNSPLKTRFKLAHLNISSGRSVADKARFDLINIWFGLVQPVRLFAMMLRHRPHLVYTNLAQNLGGFLRYASLILVARLFSTPVVVRVMGDGFNHFHRRSPYPLRKLIELVLRNVDGYIVRAEALKQQFNGLVPPERLEVVYSGIDVTEFDRPRTSQVNGPLRVLFVGYLTQAKGAHDLLRAVPAIVRDYDKDPNNPGVVIQMMGERIDVERNITYVDNPQSNDSVLDQLLSREDIGPHIELLGVLSGERKCQAYVDADIFVLPSYSEAFPTVVLEAMAAGLPVVATPVGALPEVFDDNNILYVEPGNVEQLAAAVRRLLADAELRRRMGDLNRETVYARFNLDSHADQVAEVFTRILHGPSASSRTSGAPAPSSRVSEERTSARQS
jgi:glycosyltransferase involved in cell wall biosynthesis